VGDSVAALAAEAGVVAEITIVGAAVGAASAAAGLLLPGRSFSHEQSAEIFQ
jgi:hypothetical protein